MAKRWTACPHCGAEILATARFCRHCGSSDADGWRDEYEEGYGDDTEEFDYEEFVEENFSDSLVNSQTKPVWRWVAIGLLLLFVLGYLLA